MPQVPLSPRPPASPRLSSSHDNNTTWSRFYRKVTRATPLLLLLFLLRPSQNGVRAQYVPPASLKGLPRGRAPRYAPTLPALPGAGIGVRSDEVPNERGGGGGVGDKPLIGRDGDTQSINSTDLYVISYDDFCIYGPPEPFQYIYETALDVVSWCSKPGHGTRLIPDGTLHGVTYVKASSWVQVSGTGDFTKINIAPGDAGGQFDSTTNTPSGATMYVNEEDSTASSWVTLISASTFCVRACTGDASYCPSTYDEMGCWFLTSDGVGWDDVYQDCEGDDGDAPGVVNGTTYTQGATPVPTFTAPAVSNCQAGSSVSNGQTAPPDQTWTGDSGSATSSASDDSSASATGTDSADSSTSTDNDSSDASTSWVAVQTCVPCTYTAGSGSGSGSTTFSGSGSGSGSASASTAGGTEQVGVTRLAGTSIAASAAAASSGTSSSTGSSGSAAANENGGVAAVQISSTSASGSTAASGMITSAATSTSTSKSSGENGSSDLLDRREKEKEKEKEKRGWLMRDNGDGGGTTTSDGQCCFTTWTASVLGGASATSGSGSGSVAATGTGTGTATGSSGSLKNGSSTSGASGTARTTAAVSHTTTGASSSGNSTLKSGNITSTNSSSNSTNGSSAALGRMDIVPLPVSVGGLVWVLITGVVWGAMGGVMLY